MLDTPWQDEDEEQEAQGMALAQLQQQTHKALETQLQGKREAAINQLHAVSNQLADLFIPVRSPAYLYPSRFACTAFFVRTRFLLTAHSRPIATHTLRRHYAGGQ